MFGYSDLKSAHKKGQWINCTVGRPCNGFPCLGTSHENPWASVQWSRPRASVYDTKTEAVVDTFWFRYMYLLEKKILEIFWFRYISSKAHFAYADRDSSEKRYTSGSKNETASNCKQLTNGMTGWRYIGLENMAEHRGRHSSYWFNDWQALR